MMEEKQFIKNKRISPVFVESVALCTYFMLLCFVFVEYVAPVYGNTGFHSGLSFFNLAISLCYVLVLAICVMIQKNKNKSLFLQLLVFFVVIPMLVLYSCSIDFGSFGLYMAMCVFATIVLALILLWPMGIVYPTFRIKGLPQVILVCMYLMIFWTLGRYIRYSGWENFNLSFVDVYRYRFMLRDLLPNDTLRYIVNWSLGIFSLFGIVFFAQSKKYFYLLGALTLQVVLYGFSSHKSVLFNAVAVLFAYYVLPWLQKRQNRASLLSVTGVTFFILCYALFPSRILLSVFHRVFFMPAGINFWYYEFFCNYGFLWFRHGILRSFFPLYSTIRPERLIGAEYFKWAEVNANTGFLGSGYMEGGFLILLVYAVLIGIIINFIAALARRGNSRMIMSLTLLSVFTVFLSGDLPTVLLTGGLALLLVLLWLLCSQKSGEL